MRREQASVNSPSSPLFRIILEAASLRGEEHPGETN
jgi:hypothetical protein